MTCKDCFHYEACKDMYEINFELDSFDKSIEMQNYDNMLDYCKLFKDKDKVIELPCKVGDTVYVNFKIQGDYLRDKVRPYLCKVVFIGLNGISPFMNIEYEKVQRMWQINFSDIGKTVFLSREEAEKALKELKEN